MILDSYIVGTQILLNNLEIDVADIKFKCVFIRITGDKAIVTTLCHAILSMD